MATNTQLFNIFSMEKCHIIRDMVFIGKLPEIFKLKDVTIGLIAVLVKYTYLPHETNIQITRKKNTNNVQISPLQL